jgi:hypothetical protein
VRMIRTLALADTALEGGSELRFPVRGTRTKPSIVDLDLVSDAAWSRS